MAEEKNENVIRLSDRVTVFSTGLAKKGVARGKEIKTHPVMAQKLIDEGKAVKTEKELEKVPVTPNDDDKKGAKK